MTNTTLPRPDRLTWSLGGLSRLALAGAVALPIGLWVNRTFFPEPHLQWSIVESQIGRYDDEYLSRDTPRSSLTIELINTGPMITDEIRVELAGNPEAVYVPMSPNDPVIVTEGPGTVVELGRLRLGEVAQITRFGNISSEITVLEGERQVEDIPRVPGGFAQPLAWFPDWAIYAGGLLLAGLALEVLRLRRVLAASS